MQAGVTSRAMVSRGAFCAAVAASALAALLWTGMGRAETVSLTAPNGREATADYRPGRGELPAVVIVHGFLQTREFPTVAALANTLADAGYPVLAPTLTLNVSRRKHNLPCEAVHNHTLEMDVAEVATWVEWLQKKGHRRLVLIGHSSGALAILPLLSQPAPAVQQAILLSLVDREREFTPAARKRLIRDLEARIARKDRALVFTSYTFCRRYVSTPDGLLSFVRVDRETVLRWLGASRVPLFVVLGTDDERISEAWPQLLRSRGVNVRTVAGANHFFAGPAEFDLHELVLDSLQRGG